MPGLRFPFYGKMSLNRFSFCHVGKRYMLLVINNKNRIPFKPFKNLSNIGKSLRFSMYPSGMFAPKRPRLNYSDMEFQHELQNPYFSKFGQTILPIKVGCGELRYKDIGTHVEIRGRIQVQNINRFAQLKDSTGAVQVNVPEIRADLIRRMSNMPYETFATITGVVKARPNNKVNVKLETGRIEVIVQNIDDVILPRRRKEPFSSSSTMITAGGNLTQIRQLSTCSKRLTNEELARCESDYVRNQFLKRTHTCDDLTEYAAGSDIVMCGWLDEEIRQGKFLTIRDGYGFAQIVLPNGREQELMQIVKSFPKKCVVEVKGIICTRRRPIMHAKTGMVEISVSSIRALDPSCSEEISEAEEHSYHSDENSKPAINAKVNYNTMCTHNCGELTVEDTGKEVKLCGWVRSRRMDRFLLLWDGYGVTQIIISDDNEKLKSWVKELTLESVICVEGTVCTRPNDSVNKLYSTGEIEVSAKYITLINKAIPELPFQITDYNKVGSKVLNRHRPLGLRFANFQQNLRMYAKVESSMRKFLDENNFICIGTPTLFKKTPGGAQEYIVPTREKGKYYSLVQSPQQFKQMLMIGGFDRYYQFARCYRDEQTTSERQPEFTQLDLEMSFTSVDGVIKLVEDILKASWPSEKGSLNFPFPRITYNDAMELYGTDKPWFINLFKIEGLEEFVIPSDEQPCIKMFIVNHAAKFIEDIKKEISDSTDKTNARFSIIKVTKSGVDHAVSKLSEVIPKLKKDKFKNAFQLQTHDVLFIASGKKDDVLKVLGKARSSVLKGLDASQVVKPPRFEFLWIVDFPLFDASNDNSLKLESAHHPFTHPHPDDLHLLGTDPLKVRALHYDLVLNGHEVGGGSIRIHDTELQSCIMQLLQLPEQDFSHFITSMTHGCPSMGGIALGMDRLVMLICGAQSIRDVIAFPKGGEGQDPMTNAPCEISDEDKILYHQVNTPEKSNTASENPISSIDKNVEKS